MSYTQFSTSAALNFSMQIKCEGCDNFYKVRGKLKSSTSLEADGYQSRIDKGTKQQLSENLNKVIEHNQHQLLEGDIDSVIFEPDINSWRCPRCGYAQSWMVRNFHSGTKITCMTIAISMVVFFLAVLAIAILKAATSYIYIALGIMLFPVLLVLILEFFSPWIIRHPNHNWFLSHHKKRKEAPASRKPIVVTFEG